MRDGDTETVPDEGHDQGIVPEAVRDLWADRAFGQQMLDVVVTAGGLDDQRIFEQFRQGDAVFGSQRMSLGENSAQRIIQQWIKGQIIRHDGG